MRVRFSYPTPPLPPLVPILHGPTYLSYTYTNSRSTPWYASGMRIEGSLSARAPLLGALQATPRFHPLGSSLHSEGDRWFRDICIYITYVHVLHICMAV